MRVIHTWYAAIESAAIALAMLAYDPAAAAAAQVLQLQSMVMSMLAYDPAQRPSAGELLQHEFLQEE